MLTFAFVLIVITLVLEALGAFFQKSFLSWISGLAAAVLLLVDLGIRSLQIGFPALTGTYESLLFYAAALSLVASYFSGKFKALAPVKFLAWMVVLVLLALASSPLAPPTLQPPVPALKSGWLVMHVALSFLGEALFALSFAAALYFLAVKDPTKKQAADRVTLTAISLGWPLFTAGALIFGAVWAQNAWGRWWGWDPKETWALVSWLVYTLYLHLRLFRRKSDSLAAWIAVVGFLSTVFTFLGVNFLLSGLHSY